MSVSTVTRVHLLALGLVLVTTMGGLPRMAFGVDLFFQDFDAVPLGPIVTYQATQARSREAWSPTFPAGWAVDNSAMPGIGDNNLGVTEFEGWTVVDKNWWVANEDQGRGSFFNGLGNVAVADSDEHDDLGNPPPQNAAPFDSTLTTPSISLMGAAPNTVNVSFHSSWLPEEVQKATLTARYNNGANVEVLRWHSEPSDANFHAGALNETVMLPLQNPDGASSFALEFRLFDATNNWFWAIDNLSVFTGAGVATDSVLRAIIDRDTSNVKIVNNTGEAVGLRGYSLRSGAGAFDSASATFLADSDPNWVQLTQPNASSDLSEGHLSSFNFANNGTIDFGNDVWEKFFRDDVTFSYLVAGSDLPIPAIVEFTGNSGVSYPFLDLNFSGEVEIGDWDTFRAGFPVNLTGLSEAQRYQLGDLDNDGQHTPNDFIVFRTEFNAALGAGAFEAMLAASQVPEPASLALVVSALGALAAVTVHRRRRCARRILPAVAVALLVAVCASSAQAQLTLFSENFDNLPLGPSIEEANAGTNVWTDTPPVGWTIDDSGVPGVNNPQLPLPNNNGMIEWAGWAFTDKIWWNTQVEGQGREQFSRGSGTIMVADPDEWDDQPHPDVNETSGSTADCVGDTVNPCMYDAFITTPTFNIPAGIPAGRIKLAFDSSWDDEGNDDSPHLANNQRATINVSYNGGAPINVMTWDSVPTTSPNYHGTAYNEAVERDLQYNGTSTTMSLTFGLDLAENDWWWAVDNIRVFVPANPSKLVVNTVTGQASIVGGDVIPVSINYVDITSENGVLNGGGLSGLSASTPDSVDGPDADATVGNSSGETWQVLSATDNRVTEAFLFGSSTFMDTRTQNLGAIFDASTLPANRDITFTYTNIFNDVVTGIVEYVDTAPPGITGDYNNNGVVDAADYVVWRNSLGQSVTLPNDSSPGSVTQQDYTAWRTNFGKVAGGAAAAAAVPEPATIHLFVFATLVAALASVRRRRPAGVFVLGILAGIVLAPPAMAQLPPPPFLDRNYRMGDDDTGPPSTGSTVITTFDSAGMLGMQQLIDLSGVAGPRYEALPTTSGGPVPPRPDGGTGLAIRLNPTSPTQGQHLRTGFEQALNFPERSPSSIFTPNGTIDYTFIRDRGFQLWVLPQTAARADIVMDTNQHGALVNSSGEFAMRYANADYDSGVTVTPNSWYHLMVVRPSGAGRGSIMYVNGNAVAAANGSYAGEDNPALEETTPLVIGANTGSGLQPGLQNRFQGLVDDLEMFVMGLNGARDYGEFIFERDNKYAAFFKPTNAADLTGDNTVNMADVDVFVDNWLFQNTLNWVQLVDGTPQPRSLVVGDLSSRMKGDFNYDGFVDLADWEILNDLAPPGVGAAAWARINVAIPEPSGLMLAALASIVALGSRRSGRRNPTQR